MERKDDFDEDEMKKKYQTMKKKYKELQNLRVDSVLEDIEDIKMKIQEHEKVHKEAMEHLKRKNVKLAKKINERMSGQEEVFKLADQNDQLRAYLAKKEPALGPFIDSGTGFSVKIIRRHEFEISYQNLFRAKLTHNHNEVLCEIMAYPESMAKSSATQFVKEKKISFNLSEIGDFYAHVKRGLS